jgi:hypothetical protein
MPGWHVSRWRMGMLVNTPKIDEKKPKAVELLLNRGLIFEM